MVTRIYTPPITPYSHTTLQGRVSQGAEQAGEENPQQLSLQEREAQEREAQEREQNSQRQQPTATLGSVNTAGATIPIQSVLSDFNSTMSALGVDNNTNAEVTAYLNIVKLQASLDRPDIPFVKQALKVSANTMDRYITQALGQPSSVVRDWVDALLLQPINFKQGQSTQSDVTLATQARVQTIKTPEEARRQVSDWVRQSKSLAQEGKLTDAKALVRQSLTQMDGSAQPVIQGRLHALLGRYEAQDGNKEAALRQYQRAYDRFEETPDDTDANERQARILSSMGKLYDELGQLDPAQTHYEALLRHPGYAPTPEAASQTYNDLGSIYLRQAEPQKAIDTFQLAYQQARSTGESNTALPDILSNLGAAHHEARQYQQSAQAYRLSLKFAKAQRNRDAYRSGLQSLAQLYEDANLSDRATAVRQRLNAFQDNTELTSASAL